MAYLHPHTALPRSADHCTMPQEGGKLIPMGATKRARGLPNLSANKGFGAKLCIQVCFCIQLCLCIQVCDPVRLPTQGDEAVTSSAPAAVLQSRTKPRPSGPEDITARAGRLPCNACHVSRDAALALTGLYTLHGFAESPRNSTVQPGSFHPPASSYCPCPTHFCLSPK